MFPACPDRRAMPLSVESATRTPGRRFVTDISTEIRVPKVNNNDTVYTLVEWLVGDEQQVEAGATIATLETSKSAEDLVCDVAGTLWQDTSAGAECEPGQLIARVVPPGTPRERPVPPPAPAERTDGPVITAPARALMDELGITADRVRALGVPLVRRTDVERLVADGEPDRRHVLSPVQRAVGRTVSRSHRTIPAAYTVVRVDVGAAQAAASRLGVRLRAAIGLPELLIAAVAPLHTGVSPVLRRAAGRGVRPAARRRAHRGHHRRRPRTVRPRGEERLRPGRRADRAGHARLPPRRRTERVPRRGARRREHHDQPQPRARRRGRHPGHLPRDRPARSP